MLWLLIELQEHSIPRRNTAFWALGFLSSYYALRRNRLLRQSEYATKLTTCVSELWQHARQVKLSSHRSLMMLSS